MTAIDVINLIALHAPELPTARALTIAQAVAELTNAAGPIALRAAQLKTLRPDIASEALAGRHIEAIKEARAHFNWGLKDAKDAVDHIRQGDA